MVYLGQNYGRGELPIPGGIQELAALNYKDSMGLPFPRGGNTSISCLLPRDGGLAPPFQLLEATSVDQAPESPSPRLLTLHISVLSI